LAIAKADTLLTLHYVPEDEWHGELRAEARHAGFSGQSSAWFNADALRQFAEALRTYPPKLEEPATLLGGRFSDSVVSTTPVKTHVGISIAQFGSRGRIWAQITLCEPDDEIMPRTGVISFYVEPYAMNRFADQIQAMLANGGSAGLPSSDPGAAQPGIITAREKIQRPYLPLFIELRAACNAMVDRMEQGSAELLPPSDPQMVTEEWEQYDSGLIIGTIDWDQARLILNWAVDDENPIRAARSPDYILQLYALKIEAQSKDHPRAWFESYSLYLLSEAQGHLGDFYRDGPTDDIPYNRHLIYAQGMADTAACVWIKNVVFRYDDRHSREGNDDLEKSPRN
jgi:hypothetical protein